MLSENLIKVLSVAGPVFASTLAITYDVGFFYGSDLGFFTFFTLTEHLVFALQAAPFAMVTAGGVIGWIVGSWIGYQNGQELTAKYIESPDTDRIEMLKKLEQRDAKIAKYRPYLIGSMLFTAALSFSVRNYTGIITGLFAAASVGLFPALDELQKKPSLQTIIATALVLTSLAIAFSFGYDRAQSLISSTTPTEMIYTGFQTIPSRIIRSGDKGVLFYSLESKKLRFLRWDAIKNIETV